MKTLKNFALAAVTLLVAGSANAEMLAGWDFSQYAGPGFMTTSQDSSTYVNALNANYSDLDTAGNPVAVGPAGGFGTVYFDGTNGSTNLPDTSFVNGDLTPISGSLTSNADAPNGLNFDSFTALSGDGQLNTNALRMTYVGAGTADIVFQATTGGVYTDFSFSFAGLTLSGATDVEVAFSTDGSTFGSVETFNLSTTDSGFTTSDQAVSSGDVWYRLRIAGNSPQVAFDNVSIQGTIIPEPATALMLMAGLVGLGMNSRRRA